MRRRMMKKNIDQLKKRLLSRQEELIEKLNQAAEAKYEFSQESLGELSNYDNHPADTGTELFDREKDKTLQRHMESELEAINESVHAMEEGTYGICKVCGENIDPERLEALPTADCCVEHEKDRTYLGGVPTRVSRTVGDDGKNSWREVGYYGTSSSSTEYFGDMYESEDGAVEPEEVGVEDFLAADMDGNFSHVMPNHNKYEERLDDEEERFDEENELD